MAWGVLWRSREGVHLINEQVGVPALFRTRREARKFAEQRYGYIRRRPDLRSAPHYWRMPIAVRVVVAFEQGARG